MAKPTRTFSANEGDFSTGTAGPDQIERDLDSLFAMFNRLATLPSGEGGGIGTDNFKFDFVPGTGIAITDTGTTLTFAVTGNAADVGAIANAGGVPSIQEGLEANRPASASAAGALYISTDKYRVDRWTGTAWKDVVAGVPPGGIIEWYGDILVGPGEGWALCDGLNGTPDLRDLFVVTAGGQYAVGDTGGLESVTLTTAQMPAHSHSGSTASAGNHTHSISGEDRAVSGGTVTSIGGSSVNRSASTASAGSHTHTISLNNTGGGGSHENRPPFFALARIMKL